MLSFPVLSLAGWHTPAFSDYMKAETSVHSLHFTTTKGPLAELRSSKIKTLLTPLRCLLVLDMGEKDPQKSLPFYIILNFKSIVTFFKIPQAPG